MYLKRVDLKGFKSFADRTELDFKSGITAVVGPNGSGKSNISDAIRWVLGEQSVKQLRGGKMEDVIFAGTQFRKPLGQAQVSLTLDNSCGTLGVPWNEVTVTRKLYRSGESEYLLNNNTVRLRDIHELFMDTGIGREGYSIIGQGKIDAILSGKADERRVLVEEAAGITKFRTRKEEGERKLKNAEENLERVGDIISTYEERIGPLKREKEKAEKFIILDEELKELQVSLYISNLDEMDRKNENLEEGKRKTEEELHIKEQQVQVQEEKTEKLLREAEELSSAISSKKEEYFLIKGNLDETRADLKIASAKTENLKGTLKSSEKYASETEEELRTALEERDEYQNAVKMAEFNISAIGEEERAVIKEEEELNEKILVFEKKDSELKSGVMSLKNEMSDSEREISSLRESQEYIRGKAENMKSLRDNYLLSLKLNEDALKEVSIEKEEEEKALHSLKVNSSALREKTGEITSKLSAAKEKTENLRRKARDLTGRENILKNLEDSREGYIRPVKDLMTYLEKKKSPYLESTQVLGDAVKTSSEYSLAIEAALGGYVGNIITDTDRIAGDLIGILKKENLGRVTFLPRNVIKARKYQMPDIKGINVLGFASGLVTVSDENREIIESILGGTLVLENLDDAVKAGRMTNHRMKIVTLEGDIIASGGAMTGGSRKGQRSGVISRKAEIEDIEKEKERVISEGKRSQEEEISLKKEYDEFYKEMNELLNKENSISMNIERLRERILGFKREGEKIRKLLEEGTSGSDSVSESLNEINTKVSALTEKSLELERLISVKESEEKELITSHAEILRRKEILREKTTEIRIRKNQAEEKINSSLQSSEKSAQKIAGLSGKINDFKMEMEKLSGEISETEKLITVHEKNIVDLEKSLKTADEETDSLYMEEVRIRSLIKTEMPYLESLKEEKTRTEKELFRYTLSLEKYEKEREDLILKLNEGLNLTVAEARDLVTEIESPEAAAKRISYLKGQITSLGTINTASIEEYYTVSGHYEHLTTQRDDLLKARDELTSLIREMTGKMRKLFRENFSILSENFRETFRQLFGGGTAELILGEGDELTGNIDIHVQPPGKKLQNISLLSGGEKVLSAIALTFGILRMKPSPFCILDEIEAALDDANVYRYADFLREFKGETQFILITHRKGTMEAADIMYGVTMEEKGISKIVSVNLEKETT